MDIDIFDEYVSGNKEISKRDILIDGLTNSGGAPYFIEHTKIERDSNVSIFKAWKKVGNSIELEIKNFENEHLRKN